ncbi:MAG: hypothetical protein AB1489_17970 [Acidobacteriota bacterium]
MEELRTFISKVALPIELPATAFLLKDDRVRLVDMMAIIQALPTEIKEYVDLELTISNISTNTFALPLKDGRYLFVKMKDRNIISLEIVSRY